MAITKKEVFIQNLDSFRVLIEDRLPESEYFVITQLNSQLTAGKNSFLIQGTDFLKNSTELKLELLDVNRNPIYIQPIKNYVEGRSRLVVIEIYDDVPPGPATLTILAEAAFFSNASPVPPEWRNKYNLRWQRRLVINSRIDNSTPIRLELSPSLSISEVFFPVIPPQSTTTTASFTGNLIGTPVLQGSELYKISTDTAFFSSSMERGILTTTATTS